MSGPSHRRVMQRRQQPEIENVVETFNVLGIWQDIRKKVKRTTIDNATLQHGCDIAISCT